MTGIAVLLGALALACAVGMWLRIANGRVRTVSVGGSSTLPETVTHVLDRDSAVTLVQLSTVFCATCRHAKSLLEDVAGRTAGLAYAELDVTDEPSIATRLGVHRTPTTLAIAQDGTEVLRVGGLPRRDELLGALRPHLP